MCDFLSRFPLLTTVTKTSFQSLPHLSPLDICPPFCQNVLASTLHRTGSSSSSSFSFSISSPDVPVGHNLPCFSLSYTPPVLFLNATFLSPMLYQVCSWMLKIFRSDQFHEVKDHMCLGCGDNSFSQHKWDTSDWRWERSTDVRSPLHLLRVIAKASLPITVSIPHWDENNLIIPKKRRDPAPYFSKQKQGNKWAWL